MKPAVIASLLLIFITTSCNAKAQTASPSPAQPAAAAQMANPQPTPTTEYTLPPDKLAKSKALYDISGRLRVIGTIWGFAVLLGILYFGACARFRDWAERAGKYGVLQIIAIALSVLFVLLAGGAVVYLVQKSLHSGKWIFIVGFLFLIIGCILLISRSKSWAESVAQALIAVPLLLIVLNVFEWPLAAYSHSISLQYGLSVQHWGSWFGDVLKGLAVSIVIFTIALWFLIWRIRRSPRWWWFQTWLAALPFIVFLMTILPVVIDPIFNKFEPLDKTNPQLVDAIEKVVHRGGLIIPRDRMFLMKASEKVTTLNAYVTGFGPSKRVVVWDTTVQKATTPETLFVFGHEMGHYVLNHVIIGLCAAAVGLLIGLYLLYRLSGWFLRRWGARWQIRELGDWAALPLIFLIFSILGFIAQPAGAGFSRVLEHNADVYGLEVTHGINPNSQEAAAHAFQVLGELALSYPYPSRAVVFWYYDHPPIADRVRFAHQYDPWDNGQEPKYVK